MKYPKSIHFYLFIFYIFRMMRGTSIYVKKDIR